MPATGVFALGGRPIQARPTSSTVDQVRSASLRSNIVLKHDARSDDDSRGNRNWDVQDGASECPEPRYFRAPVHPSRCTGPVLCNPSRSTDCELSRKPRFLINVSRSTPSAAPSAGKLQRQRFGHS